MDPRLSLLPLVLLAASLLWTGEAHATCTTGMMEVQILDPSAEDPCRALAEGAALPVDAALKVTGWYERCCHVGDYAPPCEEQSLDRYALSLAHADGEQIDAEFRVAEHQCAGREVFVLDGRLPLGLYTLHVLGEPMAVPVGGEPAATSAADARGQAVAAQAKDLGQQIEETTRRRVGAEETPPAAGCGSCSGGGGGGGAAAAMFFMWGFGRVRPRPHRHGTASGPRPGESGSSR